MPSSPTAAAPRLLARLIENVGNATAAKSARRRISILHLA